jgi:uncharacterized MAPEG superfamily protein
MTSSASAFHTKSNPPDPHHYPSFVKTWQSTTSSTLINSKHVPLPQLNPFVLSRAHFADSNRVSLFNLNARNYSIYTIPAAYLIAQLTTPNLVLQSHGLRHNVSPRGDVDKAATALTPAEAARVKRIDNAHQNALENFPLFAAAMIVGNEAGLEAGTLNLLAFGYLATRGLYTWLYVSVANEKTSYIRYPPFAG